MHLEPTTLPVVGWLTETRRALANLGLPPTWSEDSVEGGIRLAFRRHGRYADIEFLNSGEVIATCSGAAGEAPNCWLVSPGGAGFELTFDAIQAFLGS